MLTVPFTPHRPGIVAGFLLAAALLTGATGAAAGPPVEPAGASRPCGPATLSGRYQFGADGWVVTGSGRIPVSYAGFEEFDGKGHIKGTIRQSVDGRLTGIDHYTSTYTLGADCVASQVARIGAELTHWDLYVDPTGSRFTFIRTDPGAVTAGWEHRVG